MIEILRGVLGEQDHEQDQLPRGAAFRQHGESTRYMRSPHRIQDRCKSRTAFVSEECRRSLPKIQESDVEINIARPCDKFGLEMKQELLRPSGPFSVGVLVGHRKLDSKWAEHPMCVSSVTRGYRFRTNPRNPAAVCPRALSADQEGIA